jgi:hypothetical protein
MYNTIRYPAATDKARLVVLLAISAVKVTQLA